MSNLIHENGMKANYDFSQGRRGVHAERIRNGHRITVFSPDGKNSVVLGKTTPTRTAGEAFLLEQLRTYHLSVEIPDHKNGVDFFVGSPELPKKKMCPVVFKASKGERVHIRTQDLKQPNLLLAFVWHAQQPQKQMYAVPFRRLWLLFKERGYTDTSSFAELGGYSKPAPDRELRRFMEEHRITSGEQWMEQMREALEIR